MEFKEQFKGQPTHMTASMGGLYLDPKDIMECESDGTTQITLIYDGGVMMGADCRSSNSMYVGDKVSDKLEPVHDRIYAQRSGTSAHTRAICRYLRYYVNTQSV